MSDCFGSDERCGTGEPDAPCGFCHPDALSAHDRQVYRDFERFLAHIAPQVRDEGGSHPDWRWQAYIEGEMGAPPLLWEGDNG